IRGGHGARARLLREGGPPLPHNPGANRDADRALRVVALDRLRRDPANAGVPRPAHLLRGQVQEKEAKRRLKRYIARETYRAIL
ncbi:MAG: hypothetical protein M3N18_13325, partial [Actinomycetota bacterium]|nr:hypothetical protein [Actinomycetota bacterium]